MSGEAKERQLADLYIWDDCVECRAIINEEHFHIAPTVFQVVECLSVICPVCMQTGRRLRGDWFGSVLVPVSESTS